MPAEFTSAEQMKSNRGPRRALARGGMAANARYAPLPRVVELYK